MNKQSLPLYRTYSTSHFRNGSFSDRVSIEDNNTWGSRIRQKGLLMAGYTDSSQGTSSMSHLHQYKQLKKQGYRQRIINVRQNQEEKSKQKHSIKQIDKQSNPNQKDKNNDQIKQASIRELYEKLNLRNKRILQLQKQNKIIVAGQTSNHQRIHKLEVQNNSLQQIISDLNQDKQKVSKQNEHNRIKDEQIRKDIFVQIQKLQKAIQLKQKQITELKKYTQQEKKIQNLQSKLNNLSVQFQKQKQKANSKLQILQKVNKNNQVQLDNYDRQVEILKQQLSRRQYKQDKLTKEIKRLQQQLSKMKSIMENYHNTKRQAQQKYNQLYSQYQQVHKINRYYQRQLSQKNIRRQKSRYLNDDDLFNKIEDLKNENENLKQLLDNINVNEQEYHNSQHYIQQLQARVIKFSQRTNWLLGNNSHKHMRNESDMNSKMNELKQRVKSLNKQNRQLKFQVSKLMQKQPNNLSKQIQTQLMQINEINSTNLSNSNKTDGEQYQRRIKVYVGEIQSLKYRCDQYDGRIKQYQSNFIKLKRKYECNTDTSYYKDKNTELQQRVQQLLCINTHLKQQLQKKQNNSKQQIYQHQIKILQQRINNIQNKLDQSIKDRINMQEVITGLQIQKHMKQIITNQQINGQFDDIKREQEIFEQRQQIVKLQLLLKNYQTEIISLQSKIESLKQIIYSHQIQNQRLLEQNHQFGQQLKYNSMESQMSQSHKYLEIEFEKLNEMIQNLKKEGLKIVDEASEIKNGGQIVERIMERMRGIDNIMNTLNMIRAHMESSQRHQRYSIVIK